MHIVFLDTKTFGDDINLENFSELGDVTAYKKSNKKNTLERIQKADVVVTNKVIIDALMMRKLPKLKLICVAATGMNNIDLEEAKMLNIEVKNVVGYSTKSVVQHTFAMVLYLLEQSLYYDNYAKKEWAKSDLFTNIDKPFFEISGKKWGIVGLGNIGKGVAKIASAFGADVCYYSTSGKNNNTDYKQVSLETLLQTCAIVTIHAPLNTKTEHLIESRHLKMMTDRSIIVNVGRGGIIDEFALASVIDEKEFYAGLDVLPKEPIQDNHPLLGIKHKERLHLTPHIAWTSIEARIKLLEGVYNNIKQFQQ